MEVQKYYKREGRRFVPVELPIAPEITTNNAGKYYQKNGSFVDEQTDDSIGLCIISLTSGHVVMALDDCEGEYSHMEAMEEVKNHFNGKGEIPSVSEMIDAFRFDNKLNLKWYTDYRVVRYGNYTINPDAAVRFAGMHVSPSSAVVCYSCASANYHMNLRPIVRIK